MKKAVTSIIALVLMCTAHADATPKSAYVWTEHGAGLHYAKYSFPIGENEYTTIHAFMIDPALLKLKVVTAKDERTGATVQELARNAKALVVVNGGFFTPEHRSIGLLANDGKTLNALHRTSWWSVFSVRGGIPRIDKPSDFAMGNDVEMAIQAGPRLVVDGKVQKLKESIASRTALGITSDGMVVIAVSDGQGLSMNELASRMSSPPQSGGLGCANAMALDGGSSTQLFAKVGKFEVSVPGLSLVTNGLAVVLRK